MNDLQLALIGFGVFLVAAVWAYNLWQERKYRRQADALLPVAVPDALMAGREPADDAPPDAPVQRVEPRVAEVAAAPAPTFDPAIDGVDIQGDAPEEAASESAPAELPAEWADGRADCLVRVEFVDAVPATAIWAEKAGWAERIDKPVQWLGLDALSRRWRMLRVQDPGAVTQVAAALQLTDRKGAVSAATLATFVAGVHQLAQRFSGLVELPEPAAVQARAGELDAFCAAVDLQLTLLVLPRTGSLGEMVGARLAPLLDASGLRQEGDRLIALDPNGAELFALTCQTPLGNSAAHIETQALTGLTFSLDVPRVDEGAAAFDRMLGLARQCAEALGGQVADAHGKPLAENTVAAIRTRIDELQGKMARMAIPAGSLRAIRLFS